MTIATWYLDPIEFFLCFFQSLGVFGLCQIHSFIDYLRANMTRDNFNQLFKTLTILVASIIGLGLAVLTLSGKVTCLNNQANTS